MIVTIGRFDANTGRGTVELRSAPGKDAFLEIKGVRIIDGTKGKFVSWPAQKNEQSGKWYPHVYASEAFNSAVIKAFEDVAPKKGKAPADDSDLPPF